MEISQFFDQFTARKNEFILKIDFTGVDFLDGFKKSEGDLLFSLRVGDDVVGAELRGRRECDRGVEAAEF